jgi:foldase protein PrsA
MRHLAACLVAAALLGAGCGGDEDEPRRSESGSAERRPDDLPADVVARVGDEDITKQEADHWTEAARRQGQQEQGEQGEQAACKSTKACRAQAMQFLVSAEWLLQHARESKVVATEKEIDRVFRKQKREAFAKESDYRAFLKASGRSEADIRFQVKLNVLTDKMQKSITGAGRGKTQQQRLDAFAAQFRRRYKPVTTCRRKYVSPGQCSKLV